MKTFDLAADISKGILKWDFHTLSGGTPLGRHHAIAEVVELSDSAVPSTVEFGANLLRTTQYSEIQRIFGIGTKTTIRINSKDDGTGTGNRIANVTLKHVPWLDLLGLRPVPPPFPPPKPREVDTHFDHFYELSNPARDRNVPDPQLGLPRCTRFTGPSPMNPQCPPTLYDVNSNA
jgi:hypothetical protein